MYRSTLCYIERAGHYLMLYRNKKKNDLNAGKWVGIGGKFEPGETADECLLREVWEETGFRLTSYKFLGVVEFRNDKYEFEDMYLYIADGFTYDDTKTGKTDNNGSGICSDPESEQPALCGENVTEQPAHCTKNVAGQPAQYTKNATELPTPPCNEGDLKWIPKEEILNLNLWEGDRYFLEPMLKGETDLNMRLTYSGDELITVEYLNAN